MTTLNDSFENSALENLLERYLSNDLNIVFDENIPGVTQLFASQRSLTALPGRDISKKDVENADALIVRSVTRVEETLLSQSSVKFVGTCTIGTDHMDTAYLDRTGIEWASAPGCNAAAVLQYVIAALVSLGKLSFHDTTAAMKVAVIGCGNVGGRIGTVFTQLGHKVFCVDPFLSSSDVQQKGMSHAELEVCRDADIVCCHTPLTRTGPHASYHMLDEEFFLSLKPKCTFINAGRGAIVAPEVLAGVMPRLKERGIQIVLDVWPSEPVVEPAIAREVDYATPHIAGYSLEGKVYGTIMVAERLLSWLGASQPDIQGLLHNVKKQYLGEPQTMHAENLDEAILSIYHPAKDHQRFLDALPEMPSSFDTLRKNYPLRRDFEHYKLLTTDKAAGKMVAALGFSS